MSQEQNTKPKYSVDGHGDVYITYSDSSATTISKDTTFPLSTSDLTIVNGTFRYIDLNLLEDMCKQYPSLTCSYEKFRNVYNLCVDEYNRNNHTNLTKL